jgi:hypothetical protein
METGNAFIYNEIRKGVSHNVELRIDQSTSASAPAGATHKQIAREDGILQGSDYYETIPSILKLWGFSEGIHTYRFKRGLVTAWYPMKINDKKESSTKVKNYGVKVSIIVKVLAKEPVTLGFGTIEAFKLRYKIELSANDNNETTELYQWFVPYLGIVKYKDSQSLGKLTDFSIAGGTITPESDTDEDGLKDYEELIVYGTNWQMSDTDSDGLSDGDEINTHGTDPNDEDSDADGLSDGDEVNIYDTDPLNEDSDDDGLIDSDEVNIYGSDPNDNDSDSDGLQDGYEVAVGTNPASEDSDGDGMTDGWEDTYRLNPLVDDSADDADGDGYTNLEEYNMERHPTNAEPDTPVLLLPTDTETNVTLTPQLQTQGFSDTDEDNHAQSRWQISSVQGDFTEDSLVLDITSDSQLTSFNVPELMLSINTTYYWRAKHIDNGGAASEWSSPFEFTTTDTDEDDLNQDGIPDDQEVSDSSIDFDNNFIPDINQADMRCVNTGIGDVQCIKAGSNVTFIESFMWTDTDTIADTQKKPDSMPKGLTSFKIEVDQPGDTTEVTIYSSSPMPDRWFKFDPFFGWQDFTANASFSPDSTSVTLVITDGGDGDCDGVANGIIIDPSGPATILSMWLINPNGGETIPSGSTYTIQWDGPAHAVKFNLQYSLNNGKDWNTIQKGIIGKTYDWQVPKLKKNINKCLVRVIGYKASGNKVGVDKSNAPFTIEVVTITAPNGGETLTSGNTYNIEWDTYETKKPIFKILLKYTVNGGKKWEKIGTINGSNPGTYLWTVPAVSLAKGKCKVMVQLKDKKGNSIGSDTSDSYFTIQP